MFASGLGGQLTDKARGGKKFAESERQVGSGSKNTETLDVDTHTEINQEHSYGIRAAGPVTPMNARTHRRAQTFRVV